jgi:glycosyltransferase involved in cell wall biosynthesis
MNRRGFGRFTRNVMSRLIELDRDNEYVLYLDERTAEVADLPPRAHLRSVALRQTAARAATADSQRRPADLLRLTRAVRPAEVDLFVFPSIFTYFPVVRVPTVVGIHDAIADQFPELTMPSRQARAAWWAKERLAIRTARAVFTVSEASRRLISERFGLAEEGIGIVPEAPDAIFGPRRVDEIEAEIQPLGLKPNHYFVYAGGISPHKSIETLVAAYAALRDRLPDVPPLVVVGDLTGDLYLSAAASVRSMISELGLGDQVLLPGFVSDERLACLYAGSLAAILPSLAEGFGLPAVEAAASGTAVVCSDLPAHRETLGDGALFFPPRDIAALTEYLQRIVADPEFRADVARRGRANVSRLSWDAGAERLQAVLSAAAKR